MDRRSFLQRFFGAAAAVSSNIPSGIAAKVIAEPGTAKYIRKFSSLRGIDNVKDFQLMLDIYDYIDDPNLTTLINGVRHKVDSEGRVADMDMSVSYGDRWLNVKLQLNKIFSESKDVDSDISTFFKEVEEAGCQLPYEDGFEKLVHGVARQSEKEIVDEFTKMRSEASKPIFSDMASARKMVSFPEHDCSKPISYFEQRFYYKSRISSERMIADRSNGQESREFSR